jgi:hypothetical protein
LLNTADLPEDYVLASRVVTNQVFQFEFDFTDCLSQFSDFSKVEQWIAGACAFWMCTLLVHPIVGGVLISAWVLLRCSFFFSFFFAVFFLLFFKKIII